MSMALNNTAEELSENEVAMEDFFESSIQDLEMFDEVAWNKGEGMTLNKFPAIASRLEGLDTGLYLFAAESNAGKSALMSNILYDLSQDEKNKVFCVYYTLDDSSQELYPRIISMKKNIPIAVSAKPARFQAMIDEGEEDSIVYEKMLEKREEAIQELKDDREKFKVVDSEAIRSIEQLKDHIEKVKRFLASYDPDIKLAIAVDAINDLRFNERNLSIGNEIVSEVAREVKQWTVDYDLIVFASTHLRKVNHNRRPTLDDLRDSNVLVYEASVVWLLFNDVSKNKESADVYYQQEGDDEGKRPVIEIDWAKNKKSSFKGRTYAYFVQDSSLAIECEEEEIKQFDSVIYEL